jgi:hypothetical protein
LGAGVKKFVGGEMNPGAAVLRRHHLKFLQTLDCSTEGGSIVTGCSANMIRAEDATENLEFALLQQHQKRLTKQGRVKKRTDFADNSGRRGTGLGKMVSSASCKSTN